MGTSYEKSSSFTLNEGNGWTHTFSDLPKYRPDGVTECTYQVREAGITGYTTAYQVGGGTYTSGTVSEAIGDTEGITVNVKNSYTPKLMNLAVTKTWNDQSNKYETRPAGIKIQLYVTTNADGITGRTAVGSAVTVSAPWTYTFTNLAIRSNTTGTQTAAGVSNLLYYSIVELKADDSAAPLYGYGTPVYSYSSTTGNGSATGSRIAGSITDATGTTHNGGIQNSMSTVSVTVEKVWADRSSVYADRPEVRVQLLYRLYSLCKSVSN